MGCIRAQRAAAAAEGLVAVREAMLQADRALAGRVLAAGPAHRGESTMAVAEAAVHPPLEPTEPLMDMPGWGAADRHHRSRAPRPRTPEGVAPRHGAAQAAGPAELEVGAPGP